MMYTELILPISILFLLLFPGSIVMTSLGNKFQKPLLKIFGCILVCVLSVAYIAFLSVSTGSFLLFLIFVLPILLLFGSCFMVVIGITQIIKGFMYHKGNSIALGFVLVGLAAIFIVVPIALVSTFGLPISFM